MIHQMRLSFDELDLSVSALEILSPDTEEDAEIAEAFEQELRTKTAELETDFRERSADPEGMGRPDRTILITADEARWEALISGLDVIQPDDEAMADLAASLAGRVRFMIETPEPSL